MSRSIDRSNYPQSQIQMVVTEADRARYAILKAMFRVGSATVEASTEPAFEHLLDQYGLRSGQAFQMVLKEGLAAGLEESRLKRAYQFGINYSASVRRTSFARK